MSDSVRPHRRQLTRLPHLWDSPGNNSGVGCHFLLQCMKVKSESEVAQSYPTLFNPMDCSLPGFSVHGNFQTRIQEMEQIAISSSRGSSWPRDQTRVSCASYIGRQILLPLCHLSSNKNNSQVIIGFVLIFLLQTWQTNLFCILANICEFSESLTKIL